MVTKDNGDWQPQMANREIGEGPRKTSPPSMDVVQ
jgi:hypothetical protein